MHHYTPLATCPEPPPTATATATIVVPVHNQPAEIGRCLRALRESTRSDFRVVVVDDSSSDQSAQVASAHGAEVIRLENGPYGPAAARNRAAEIATSEYLVFVDSDVCVHPETVDRLLAPMEADDSIAATFGSYDDAPSWRKPISLFRNLLHHYVHQTSKRMASTFWSGCGAIRTSVFLDLGGYSSEYERPSIEDIELGSRIVGNGGKVVLERTALATHLKRWTLGSMVHTDLFRRAVPWLQLIWRNKKMANDLNVRRSQRLCAIAAGMFVLALLWGCVQSLLVLPLLVAACFALSTTDSQARNHRSGAALTGFAITGGLFAAALWLSGPIAAAVAIISMATIVGINAPFYRFVAHRHGLTMAAFSAPLHVIYFIICATSIPTAMTMTALSISSVKAPERHRERTFRPSLAEQPSGAR